jgi:hypothetical protein
MLRVVYPTVHVCDKPYDIPCDVCGKPLAQVLIALSALVRIRKCLACWRLGVGEGN